MLNRLIIILALIFYCSDVLAQRSAVWCFGDSAGLDFKTNPPSTFISGAKSRGSAFSIADISGNLLFYGFTRATFSGNTTKVFNRTHSLIQNGSNIVGQGWYLELLSIPDPLDTSNYYIFSIGETSSGSAGLYYTKVDMSLDGGLGGITQKNVPLLSNKSVDCISAVKHGNGRDWWIFFKHYDSNNNEFYKFLVSLSGISGPFVQNIGTPSYAGFIRMIFNQQGTQLAVVNYGGQIETMDFDRCSGLLSNVRLITPQFPSGPWPELVGGEYSSNGNYLYISTNGSVSDCKLMQINLQDSNAGNTIDTLFTMNQPEQAGGLLKLAPDNRIYWSNCYWDGTNFQYPYNDTTYNIYNTYLSVINSPDSLGSACDFQPYSFYLGGARTYWGLPNNPNYELGADSGSFCDSLTTGVFSLASPDANFHVYYHSDWEIAFINAEKLTGNNYSLQVFDLSGRKVFEEGGPLHSSYFTKDLLMSGFSSGLYIISLQTEKERMVKKFVKE